MKKIISIGFDIPGYSDNYKPYTSSQSLLDADIIIFEPSFYGYSTYDRYQGKRSFNDNESFRITEDTRHWHSEISTALQDGKTVFVFMGKYEEVYIRTGEKRQSGTGRNAQVTHMVSPYDNYKFLPAAIPKLIPKEGSELKFNNQPIFITFWNEFKELIKYESYIDGEVSVSLFSTKTGNKALGGLFKVGKGNLILLPPIRYPKDFTTRKGEKEYWSEKSIKFGKRLIQVLIDIDKSLRSETESTPPPTWLDQEKYELKSSINIKKRIEDLSSKIEELTTKKNNLLSDLQMEEELKKLLFEKGKPLENAIIGALKILGYKAENFDNGSLELDQIIISPEGDRFIGENEGKDTSAIAIDKFRQLESNIQEDLQREEVRTPAIGILFGNGFRVTPPHERAEQFTEKCVANAVRSNSILIQTPDLFEVAKHIKENNDKAFAKKCRKVILENRGKIVKFPDIKNSKD